MVSLFRTLVKPSDPGDHRLRKERENAKIPWFKSPFPKNRDRDNYKPKSKDGDEEDEEEHEHDPNALEVEIAHEVAWLDLLLELAMTTAFANLADNTEIQSLGAVASYVAFIALVWWIWASQVAYNMRFRQADWFHRCCAFIQLAIFSAMAAFTHNFDITTDLVLDNDEAALANSVSKNIDGASNSGIFAKEVQSAALPIINAKGIAIVMVCSRLLMLAQYASTHNHARKALLGQRKALNIHLIALIISTVFFGASWLVISNNFMFSIIKIILWYTAILIEIVAHFVANNVPGHVRYNGEAVFERSSTAFIVILGIGLDKITAQFQFVVGTLGFGAASVLSSISIAVILIGLFSLYFASATEIKAGNQRSLTYFLAHFPFMASILIMLKGVGSLLSVVNLTSASVEFSEHMGPVMADALAGKELIYYNYPLLTKDLLALGLSIDDLLGTMTNITLDAIANNVTDGGQGARMQFFFKELLVLYRQFEALPEAGSELDSEFAVFFNNPSPSANDFAKVVGNLTKDGMTPALWFMGTAGIALILLSLLALIRQIPRDKFEWGGVLSSFFGGLVFASLSVLDIGSSKELVTIEVDPVSGLQVVTQSSSVIWKWAESGWILPSFALLLIIINAVNGVLIYFARRPYRGTPLPTGADEGPYGSYRSDEGSSVDSLSTLREK